MIEYYSDTSTKQKSAILMAFRLGDQDFMDVLAEHNQYFEDLFQIFHHPDSEAIIFLVKGLDHDLPRLASLAFKCREHIDPSEFKELIYSYCENAEDDDSPPLRAFDELYQRCIIRLDGDGFQFG